jgi:hypothetical protein
VFARIVSLGLALVLGGCRVFGVDPLTCERDGDCAPNAACVAGRCTEHALAREGEDGEGEGEGAEGEGESGEGEGEGAEGEGESGEGEGEGEGGGEGEGEGGEGEGEGEGESGEGEGEGEGEPPLTCAQRGLADTDLDTICDDVDNCVSIPNTDQLVTGGQGIGAACSLSCLEILYSGRQLGSGYYFIDPDGLGPDGVFGTYCDMTTDGGGIDIVYATSGADDETALTADVDIVGNPFAFVSTNSSRKRKAELSRVSSVAYLVRSDGALLKWSGGIFTSALRTAGAHDHRQVTLFDQLGSVGFAWVTYSTVGVDYGGDFSISDGVSDSGCNPAERATYGVDHHNPLLYSELNCNCAGQIVYSYSAVVADGDAGYDAAIGFGGWTATNGCGSEEGGSLVFYAGMRAAFCAAWPGYQDTDGDLVNDACDPCPTTAANDTNGDGVCDG